MKVIAHEPISWTIWIVPFLFIIFSVWVARSLFILNKQK